MAQTALTFNQFGDASIGELTKEQAEKEVKRRLKEYSSLPAAITKMENRAKRLGKKLTGYEKQLVAIARVYVKGDVPGMHQEKAERYFASLREEVLELGKETDSANRINHAAALDELSAIMIGTQARGGDAEVWNGTVYTLDQVDRFIWEETQKITERHIEIKQALWELARLDMSNQTTSGSAAYILKLQYVDGLRTAAVIDKLQTETNQHVPESTYYRWLKEAVQLMGELLGLC